MMRQIQQAVCLADISSVRDWEHFASLGPLRSWMGVPLIVDSNLAGFLSLGRLTHSPFNRTERDTAQVFASRIAHSFEKQKIKQVRQYLEKTELPSLTPNSVPCF